ncbi:ABC1 family-domain-containing protein [Aspergillus karnatakaensis]|uniref:ABC1 kinase family protein n=1 Tax=Aspergillus karnatakaensis TaxID=1810916 RepID=UPI003CCD916A
MRLIALLHLLLLLVPFTCAGFSSICIKVVTALAARPNDLFNKFQHEICDRGCQPTVPHWDLWTRNNTFVPAVRSVMQTLNAPKQEEAMVKLGDDVADIIKRQCGPKLQGRHICADSHVLAAFGNCFKKNFVKAAISNLPTLLPMASEPVCRKPTPPKTYRRTRKWLRRLFYLSLATGAVYVLDTQFYASSLTRTTRTFSLGLLVALDYKINFRPKPPLADSIADVHARNAERLSDLLRHNGGLYLKIGQAVAMQSAILPPEFQKMFARMFDDAPQNDWKDVEKVIREDFGKFAEEVFGVSFTGDPTKGLMERTARASASVAQVHWARLADGREVAIKIQKREIAQQIKWDLWAFKVVAWIYSRVFDIPFYGLVPYVSERLFLETDFENEADNSESMAKFVAGESRLRDRVYIPKVYRELSSKRVMTAEWVEGVRLWDKETITRPWRGGWRQGSPGCGSTPLDAQTLRKPTSAISRGANYKIKPERDEWRGRNGRGGLGLSLKEVMTTMVDLFSAQMFLWGLVHCDPHPGNIFIRRKPNGHSELVLIDHGLYIQMEPEFRHQYASFWKALLTFDNESIGDIVKEWGVNNPDIFASATLMKPYRGGNLSTQKGIEKLSKSERAQRHYEMQQASRKAIRDILGDETKWPRQLIFIGRNLRIVQGNNQFLGSPVNRIKITGMWASRALVESPDLPLAEKIRNYGRHLLFRVVLFSSDIFFYFTKVRQFLHLGGGMEDDLEAQMQSVAKDMGVELNHSVFEG